MWKHQMLADAAALEPTPPAMAPETAQQWCNFVLWTPERVPAGCALLTGTLRKEGPPGRVDGHTDGRTPWTDNNPVAYRFEVSGQRRRLRVKQFLYDWAFPALDHPCLWGSQTRAVPIDDRYVLWFGVDYLGKQAASARLARTTVELSVTEGEFSEDEILGLYRALRPAVPQAVAPIVATPLAVLGYWARRPAAAKLVVPVGLLKFRRRRTHECWWAAGEQAAQLATEHGIPTVLAGLELDSAARFRDDRGAEEVEMTYVGGHERGRELRLIAQRQGRGSLQLPAEREDHPGTVEQVRVCDQDVQLGWIDDRYGPFQAVFTDPHRGLEATLLSSTGVGLDRRWFLGAVRTLLEGTAPERTALEGTAR